MLDSGPRKFNREQTERGIGAQMSQRLAKALRESIPQDPSVSGIGFRFVGPIRRWDLQGDAGGFLPRLRV